MVKDMNTFQIALFIKDSLGKELGMVEVFSSGQIDRFMMVSGRMGIKQEAVCGLILKVRVIWDSGKMIKFKVLVFL
jgi:hypothetical protein